MNTATATIDSKNQNRIEIFKSAAYQINDGDDVARNTQTARLAFYNMSIEAQNIVCDWHEETFGKNWR